MENEAERNRVGGSEEQLEGCEWWFWIWIGWPIWVTVMSFPEWGWGGGWGGQWAMVQARELSGVCTFVFVCGLFLQLLNSCLILSDCDNCIVFFAPNVHLSILFAEVHSLLVSSLALVWTWLVWGGFVSIHSLLLFWPHSEVKRWLSFIQFVYKFDHSCVVCALKLSGAQAETVMLL